MKYLTFNIMAENKHSKGQKVDRPIMFEVHDITDTGFVFRFRDIKLKHCTSSLSINTSYEIGDQDGNLHAHKIAVFLSQFLKNYYTYATWVNKNFVGKDRDDYLEYGLTNVANEDFVDFKSMAKLKLQMDDNSISPTVVKGIITSLDELISGESEVEIEFGEKTKNVQKNRLVLDFQHDYMASIGLDVVETVNA